MSFILLPVSSVKAINIEGFAEGAIISVISWAATLMDLVVGTVITIVIKIFVSIAEYNNFINEDSIIDAWVIIRDLCNMFFILILLVIAFATILKIESYNAKKLLPKLLIMAVLINFSRTICGIFIDIGQVIMLTFISVLGDTGGDWINTLGVNNYMAAVSETKWSGELSIPNTAMGLVLSFVFLIIALVVMVVLLVVLVMRIVLLWIYIVLSPLAFLLMSFPQGQKYASQWWGEFSKQIIVGPVLAFFMWFSLMAVKTVDVASLGDSKCFGPTKILCPDQFLNFVIAIALLMGGLMITQRVGGMTAKAASKASGFTKLALGKTADYANRKQAGGFTIPGTNKTIKGTGWDFSPTRFYDRVKTGFEEGKKEDLRVMQARSGTLMQEGGIKGLIASASSDDFTKEVIRGPFGLSGISSTFMGGRKNMEVASVKKQLAEAKKAGKRYDDEEVQNLLKDFSNIEGKWRQFGVVGKKNVMGDDKAVDYWNELQKKDENAIDKEIKTQGDLSIKRSIAGFEGDKAFLSSVSEAKSKIATTDEDDVSKGFREAVQRKDKEAAAAALLKASEMGGLNTLLYDSGYSSIDAGYTKEEAEEILNSGDKDRIDEYNRTKGVNDLIRDVLINDLQMDEQRALAIQGEMAGINFGNNHFYGAKTISFKNGKRVQNSRHEQREKIMGDLRKGDIETVARKTQKAGLGGLDAKGDYHSSGLGQELMLTGWKSIAKEINNNRWNQSTASVMGREKEVKKLEELYAKIESEMGADKALEVFGTIKLKDLKDGDMNIKDYFEEVKKYAKKFSDDTDKVIEKAINPKEEEKSGETESTTEEKTT